MRLSNPKSLIDRAMAAFAFRRSAKAATVTPRVLAQVQSPPRSLTLEEQWARVADVVMSSGSRVDAVRRMQAGAEQQLDSATYALQGLLRELSTVMSVPQPRIEGVVVELQSVRAAAPARQGALAA